MIKSLLPSLSAVLLDVLCAGYCPHALTVFFQIYLRVLVVNLLAGLIIGTALAYFLRQPHLDPFGN